MSRISPLVLSAALALAGCVLLAGCESQRPVYRAAAPDEICDGPYRSIFCDSAGYHVGYDGVRVRDRNNRCLNGGCSIAAPSGPPPWLAYAPPEPEDMEPWPLDLPEPGLSPFAGTYSSRDVVPGSPEFGRLFNGPGFSCQSYHLIGHRDLGETIDCD